MGEGQGEDGVGRNEHEHECEWGEQAKEDVEQIHGGERGVGVGKSASLSLPGRNLLEIQLHNLAHVLQLGPKGQPRFPPAHLAFRPTFGSGGAHPSRLVQSTASTSAPAEALTPDPLSLVPASATVATTAPQQKIRSHGHDDTATALRVEAETKRVRKRRGGKGKESQGRRRTSNMER